MDAETPLGFDMNALRRHRARMPRLARLAALALAASAACSAASAATDVVVVEGLAGEPRYAAEFSAQTAAIEAAARTLRPAPAVRVFRGAAATRDAILAALSELAARHGPSDLLFLYLVGHGSYDEHEYKFNLPGPDLSDADVAGVLPEPDRGTVVIVDTGSASGAAHDRWQGGSRLVITATKSGVERHATHFGTYFAAALADPGADLDKDDRVTAAEAFSYASRGVAGFFDADGRLATEHARLSGPNADRIELARLGAAVPAPPADPAVARLLAARDDLAGRIDALRRTRDQLPPDRYDEELLRLMLELAELEERIEGARAGEDGP